MALKRLVSAISVAVLIACTAQADLAFKHQSGVTLFQHYAQASCLATAFTEGEIHEQAVSALNGYREFGDMPLEAYEELITPIQQWLQKDYATQAGKQNNLMKCIDFAQSELVTKIYHGYAAALPDMSKKN
jgi:hypothetical protein